MAGGRKLFGTDGVRGEANVDLTPDLVMDLARATGQNLRGPVLVGRDTRRSGDMLSAALQAGFHSVGVDTLDVGVMPVGGISHLTRHRDAHLGAVVSASHNPAPDNGIKFLDRQGSKLSDEREAAIEARFWQAGPWPEVSGHLVGMRLEIPDATHRYVDHLLEAMPYTLRGIGVVLDCANGAAFRAAPLLFERLKADLEVLAADPDGTNINQGCGSTHPEFLVERARGRLGLAFDGDADRLVAVDEEGVPADGDVIMAVIAAHWKEQGRLAGDRLVTTVMSNLGFRRAMEGLGIAVVETQVGDRYVVEAMRRNGAVLGGEQSGHVVFLDRARTGDGLLTALRLVEVMAGTGRTLAELRRVMTEYPQVLRNVRVADKRGLEGAQGLWRGVREAEERLGADGRVLVRASGTEPLVRVMVEAPSAEQATEVAEQLAELVRSELGEVVGST